MPVDVRSESLIIAELSGNHGGTLARALMLVDAAADSGATAVKTQAFFPETLTLDCHAPGFVIEDGIWKGRSLFDLYRETQTPPEWHEKIRDRARERGLKFMASVFCRRSADLIAGLEPDAIKIASLEIVDTPLIGHAAMKRLPMIMSCGMASVEEITNALIVAQNAPERALLYCPPGYPASVNNVHLQQISAYARTFGTAVGLSDHTLSTFLPAVAIGAGATVIEKHLTLSRTDGGPDAEFSLEPDEFATMSQNCREAWQLRRRPSPSPEPHRHLRRSLYVVKDIALGEEITEENVRSIRPGHGLEPKFLPDVLGRKAAVDLAYGTPLAWEHVAPEIREAAGHGVRVF